MGRASPTGVRRRSIWLATGVVASLCLWASAATGMGLAAAGGGSREADLEVALRTSSQCEAFADHLPALVLESAAGPDHATQPVAVCVRNAGNVAGRITIGVEHVLEQELACSPDEAAVDADCGGGQVGEIGPALRQVVAVEKGCSGRIRTEVDVGLLDLGETPVVINESLRPRQTACFVLHLRYLPDRTTALRAQTDAITWHYTFTLTSN